MKYLQLYVIFGLIMGFFWFWAPVLDKNQGAIMNQGLPKRFQQDPEERPSKAHWVYKLVWGIYFAGGAILLILLFLKIIPA